MGVNQQFYLNYLLILLLLTIFYNIYFHIGRRFGSILSNSWILRLEWFLSCYYDFSFQFSHTTEEEAGKIQDIFKFWKRCFKAAMAARDHLTSVLICLLNVGIYFTFLLILYRRLLLFSVVFGTLMHPQYLCLAALNCFKN